MTSTRGGGVFKRDESCKVLCICNHGNVRSAALRKAIWRLNGSGKDMDPLTVEYEAIAIGGHSTTLDTLHMLVKWADKIVDMSEGRDEINMAIRHTCMFHHKEYIRKDIGSDVWKNPEHPELIKIAKKIVKEII